MRCCATSIAPSPRWRSRSSRWSEAGEAFAALRDGTLDATFRALPERPAGLAHTRVLDEPLQLLIGPAHPLAGARSVRLHELAGHRIWIPGIVEGSEWAAFYAALAAEFGLEIDALGPNFGTDAMLESLAGSSTLATFAGERPAMPGLRRIPVRDPTPVYPHSLVWRAANPHPALAALRAHLGTAERRARDTWTFSAC